MSDARSFLEGFATFTGCPSWLAESAGTFVCADETRRGGGRVSACRIVGDGPTRTVLRADPNLGEALVPLTSSDAALSDADFLAWSEANGAEVLGRAIMKTLVEPVAPPRRKVLQLDWNNAENVRLIEGFVATVDDDDLDEAEIELDDLEAELVREPPPR